MAYTEKKLGGWLLWYTILLCANITLGLFSLFYYYNLALYPETAIYFLLDAIPVAVLALVLVLFAKRNKAFIYTYLGCAILNTIFSFVFSYVAISYGAEGAISKYWPVPFMWCIYLFKSNRVKAYLSGTQFIQSQFSDNIEGKKASYILRKTEAYKTYAIAERQEEIERTNALLLVAKGRELEKACWDAEALHLASSELYSESHASFEKKSEPRIVEQPPEQITATTIELQGATTKKTITKKIVVPLIVIFLAAGFVALPLVAREAENQKAIEEEAYWKSMEQPLPKNGHVFTGSGNLLLAPLTIQLSANDKNSYFIKLKHESSGRETFSFFVRAGKTIGLDVPLGSYIIQCASGETWYGKEEMFGTHTSYTQLDEVFVFTFKNGSYKGFTLELYPQTDGNLSDTVISKEEFM